MNHDLEFSEEIRERHPVDGTPTVIVISAVCSICGARSPTNVGGKLSKIPGTEATLENLRKIAEARLTEVMRQRNCRRI